MFNNSNGYSLADIAAATGNNGNRNNDGGFGFNGDGAWVILLFIILLAGGNWGNNGYGGFGGGSGNGGGGGGNNFVPYFFNTTSDVQRGFDQQALTSGIAGLQNGIYGLSTQLCNTSSDLQQTLCSGFAGVNGNMANGFSQAEIAANARQMANMNQDFASQTAIMQQLNNMAMTQQNCCCENRAATADLKYTVATEACADRAAVDGALRDVTAQGVANTQALLNTINGGIQSIKDQLCQDKIDAKNEVIANLRQELAMKDLAASQVAQNAFIQQGFANEVDQLYNRLNNCPVPTTPVYGRTPIFTCNNNGWDNNGCGCNGNGFYN